MEALKKTHNMKLTQHIIFYLHHNGEIGSKGEEILFKNLETEIVDMMTAGVIMPIIFSYLLTCVQMLKVSEGYDLMINSKKLDKILSLMFPNETERKTALSQLILFCIKGSMKLHENADLANIINETLSKIDCL